MAQALASAAPISERRRSVDYTGCAQGSYLFVCPAELRAIRKKRDRRMAQHERALEDITRWKSELV